MHPAIKTLIVDDEPIARQVLRQELDLIPGIQVVGEAENGNDALQQISALQPDLVFLDLQMPGMGGFEMIRHLSGTHLPVIVIVTAYNQHAINAFDAGAVDYLLKPVRCERLHQAVERAKGLLGKPREIARDLAKISSVASEPPSQPVPPQRLVGRIGREYFLLDMNEILALQAEGELVWIITSTGRFLASQRLRAIEKHLHPSAFQRVHRNAIVNLKHVRKMSALTSNRWLMTLTNDLEFVVSKRQAHNARRILHC
ncbi:MAG TPA: LytTR family DNA-binding domain-containing protein [Bryobacteraceae bacterium]|jgi:two-component system LytT family response regulator|nr:LytTR family DNA-binding domain-containing protein [Bryobacteraceae bacterium]